MVEQQIDPALLERQRAEALFHDHKYEAGDAFPRHYRINPTLPVFERMFAMLGENLFGTRVLEYGCGAGWITTQLARRGASVAAFDISPEAVAQTRGALTAAAVADRCEVRVMGGESLQYDDGSFDVAIGFAILHHLDLDRALPELHRVLKPGGRAYFAEPLASSPLIRLYRHLTPRYRTADEEPIDIDRLAARLGSFTRFTHQEQLLLASGAMGCCYVPGLSAIAAPLQRVLMRVDDLVLQAVPRAGKWAWYSILVLEK